MIVYGKNTTKEVILANRDIYKVYLDNKFNDKQILSLLKQKKINYIKKSKHDLNVLTDNGVHQGIVMEVKDYETMTLNDVINKDLKKIVMLDKVSDPQNLGAIVRTCEAFKVDALIIANKGQAQITPLVAKIASGALEYLNVVVVDNLYQTLLKLKENNYYVIGSSLDGQSLYEDIKDSEKVCLILGSEGLGMSYMLKENSDILVKIPMQGEVNSLNVSVATGILIYEIISKKIK